MRDYSKLTREQLEQRLNAAEDVVVMWSWCAARDTRGGREAATHELWLWWLGLGGTSERKDNPHLTDELITALAERRHETRRRTLERLGVDSGC
jgi:hypothetical protein